MSNMLLSLIELLSVVLGIFVLLAVLLDSPPGRRWLARRRKARDAYQPTPATACGCDACSGGVVSDE